MSEGNSKGDNKFVLILGIVSSIIGIITNVIQLLAFEYSKSLFATGIILVLLYFMVRFFKTTEGLKSYIILSIIVLIVIGGALINLYLYGYFEKKDECLFKSNLIGIGITKFNNSNDHFSSLVYEFFGEQDLPDSIYHIRKVPNSYFDQISDSSFYKEMDSLCFDSGIIISGKRYVDEGLFYCKIRVKNLYNRMSNDTLSSQLLTFRNPNVHEFSMDYQAEMLVDFVLGILSFSEQDYEKSERLFNQCLTKNKNSSNVKFLYECNVFLGDIYSIEQKPEEALSAYLRSYELIKTDEILESIVNTYITQDNYAFANEYYEKIENKSDSDLKSIKNQLDQLSLNYNKLKKPSVKPKTVTIYPQGSITFYDSEGAELVIDYIDINEYLYENKTFYIFEENNGMFGVFDETGILLKLPEFEKLESAKNFIRGMLK
ncbi:tetratricopeptide repeat protein [Fulvivirga maritima]|uniref:tetratricopeptide repeat protein n=1 Tax=Fulvivirga maritima TaxID=2904247 RepID=UPI001F33A951|nr:tetratricopeptide repeat protein [Fulvivirga maritima]UII28283.1 tetratricopeptide repeat protein [Fulvivirga maritima]